MVPSRRVEEYFHDDRRRHGKCLSLGEKERRRRHGESLHFGEKKVVPSKIRKYK